jgi:hypothetical protein
MNSKAAIDDWRIVLIYPLLFLIDLLLKVRTGLNFKRLQQIYSKNQREFWREALQRILYLMAQSALARWLFDKYRSKENIRNIISKVTSKTSHASSMQVKFSVSLVQVLQFKSCKFSLLPSFYCPSLQNSRCPACKMFSLLVLINKAPENWILTHQLKPYILLNRCTGTKRQ